MRRHFLLLGFSGLLLAFTAGRAASGPLEDAQAAERRDDHKTAIPLYRSLANAGNLEAQKRLGYFYQIGWGFKQDWTEAAKWFSKAGDAGDADAVSSLSFIGRNWPFMYKNSSDEAVYAMVQRAAQKGYAVAQMSLGIMNYTSDYSSNVRRKNLSEALVWYRRAAAQGDADAQLELAKAYEDGIGVPQDYVEAHKWFNLAASAFTYEDLRAAARKRRDELAQKRIPSQIAEAQKLAPEWTPKPER
jgi:TPR repeat protein